MKKTLVAVLGLIMLAPMAWAQTNVLSQNAVGYVKISAEPGKLYLVRYDFLSIDGSPQTIADILGDSAPFFTTAHVWDKDSNGYESTTHFGGGAWNPAPTVAVAPGQGFWIDFSSVAAAADIYLLGEVPGENNASETTTITGLDFDLVGFPYPAQTDVFSTGLASNAPSFSIIHRWDAVAQSYKSATKFAPTVWSGDATTLGPLNPGDGFWIQSGAGTVDMVETKPYAWP